VGTYDPLVANESGDQVSSTRPSGIGNNNCDPVIYSML